MPFFSIIIPVYNVAPYLRECLDSVLAQTFTDWEAICVDDGSTDGSGAILDEYAAKDKRFRVFHQPNAGVSAARNRALDLATGQWVSFLDADDVYRTSTLEKWISLISKNPECDIVGGELCKFNRKPFFPRDCACEVKGIVTTSIGFDSFSRNFFLHCYKSTLVEKNRFPELTVGEDGVFWGKALDNCSCFVATDFVNYGYRIRVGSAMHSKLTSRKLMDDATHHLLRARIITDSEKKYSRQILSYLIRQMFSIGEQLLLLPEEERGIVQKRYYAILTEFNALCLFPRIQRAMIWFVIVLRSELAIRFFGMMPYRMYAGLRGMLVKSKKG